MTCSNAHGKTESPSPCFRQSITDCQSL